MTSRVQGHGVNWLLIPPPWAGGLTGYPSPGRTTAWWRGLDAEGVRGIRCWTRYIERVQTEHKDIGTSHTLGERTKWWTSLRTRCDFVHRAASTYLTN